jgi:hypothetical protein
MRLDNPGLMGDPTDLITPPVSGAKTANERPAGEVKTLINANER